MDNIVQKIYDFIIYLVNIIKDLVAAVSGKAPVEPTPAEEETTVDAR